MIRFAFVLWFVAGCTDDGGPRLVSASPAVAGPGVDIVLAGSRLCTGDCTTTGGEIVIGANPPQTRAIVKALADDSATIQIPSGTPNGATVIIAEVGDRDSNALAFTVLSP